MSSADLHPNLFTGYVFDFRRNVIRAIIDINVTQNEMIAGGRLTQRQFSKWLNSKNEPKEEEIETLIEWLKSKGYEWQ